MTIAEIAVVVNLSPTTVRHWLRRLCVADGQRGGPACGARSTRGETGGEGTHGRDLRTPRRDDICVEGRGYYRCRQCRIDQIASHRRRLKEILVAESGGCCRICGYNRCVAALAFHHVDPLTKRLGISAGGLTLSAAAVRAEAAKCILLCANCHAEVESGMRARVVE